MVPTSSHWKKKRVVQGRYTRAKQARQIIGGGGHYLLVVKRNQRALYDEIAAAFDALPLCNQQERELWRYAQTCSQGRGHGRHEHYTLESTTALNGYIAFPGVAQVLRRTRITRHKPKRSMLAGSWVTTHSTEFLITSLSQEQVTLEQIARLRRWHWTIENVTHDPRDVSFGEDHCQVRSGNAPQALAAFRNAVAAVLHINGWPYLPNAFRYYRRYLQKNLQLIGAIAT